MRQRCRAVFMFAVGLVTGLLLESHVPPIRSSVMVLAAILALLVVGLLALSWPEISHWAWMRRQRANRYDLVVSHVLDVHAFLAVGHGGSRFRVEGDPGDDVRPPVEVGSRVAVTGKLTRPMRGAHNTLVGCRIRTLDADQEPS